MVFEYIISRNSFSFVWGEFYVTPVVSSYSKYVTICTYTNFVIKCNKGEKYLHLESITQQTIKQTVKCCCEERQTRSTNDRSLGDPKLKVYIGHGARQHREWGWKAETRLHPDFYTHILNLRSHWTSRTERRGTMERWLCSPEK